MGERKFTHVIFDMDGLLLTSEQVYTDIFNEVLAEFNKEYPYSIKRKMMGMPLMPLMHKLIAEMDLNTDAESLAVKMKAKHTEERWEKVEKMPGVERIVTHLAKFNVPIAIATGSDDKNFRFKTKRHQEMVKLFSHAVKGGDPEVKNGKPDPEVYLVASRRFPTPPLYSSNVLVFEDAPNGVISALQAGMFVVWVPDVQEPEGFPDHPIIQSNKDRLIRLKSLNDFVPEEFGLPHY